MSCASSQVARNREIGAELSHLTVESSALILMWPRPQGTGKSGLRSGPCSQRGSRAAPILLLCPSQQHDYLAMLLRKECSAALASVMGASLRSWLEHDLRQGDLTAPRDFAFFRNGHPPSI